MKKLLHRIVSILCVILSVMLVIANKRKTKHFKKRRRKNVHVMCIVAEWKRTVHYIMAVTVHRCLNGCAPPYLSDYCVPAAGADTRHHLRSTNRQLLAVPRYRLNTYGVGPFQLPAPKSGTLSQISSGTRPSVRIASDVCLKRTCSLDTSALEVLDVNRAL